MGMLNLEYMHHMCMKSPPLLVARKVCFKFSWSSIQSVLQHLEFKATEVSGVVISIWKERGHEGREARQRARDASASGRVARSKIGWLAHTVIN